MVMHQLWMGVNGGLNMITRRKETAGVAPPRPRKENIWKSDGLVLVSRVQSSGDVFQDVAKAVDFLGGMGRLVEQGDEVTLVPNFNSDDPFPATSDLTFVRAVMDVVRGAGASRVILATSSGLPWLPTSETVRKLGVLSLAREMGVELVLLDEDEFYDVPVHGKYLRIVSIPRTIYQSKKLIYLPCMKTHQLAKFTMSIKLPMTFPHPVDRGRIHTTGLERNFPEISLAIQPDLIIMDGRKAFVTGGPDRGTLVEPGMIMASGDMVAIDVEGLNILQKYQADNKLDTNVWHLPPILLASSHSLGVHNKNEYRVVESDAQSPT
ncbi:MAG: DUF362 domain-containing protein [Chloroflexi bacterium]|nr:DUF362 domain-containing protein [Chloroflexota bacterium]